ncbi:hypothetical protein BDW62DRAFT_126376 [Aspergillus aurantiobrunneus]
MAAWTEPDPTADEIIALGQTVGGFLIGSLVSWRVRPASPLCLWTRLSVRWDPVIRPSCSRMNVAVSCVGGTSCLPRPTGSCGQLPWEVPFPFFVYLLCLPSSIGCFGLIRITQTVLATYVIPCEDSKVSIGIQRRESTVIVKR